MGLFDTQKKIENITIQADRVEVVTKMTPVEPKKPSAAPPPPDLSTKPADKIGYCFGWACPKRHVNGTFETINIEGHSERRVCQECGGICKPSVVKRTAEASWECIDILGRLGSDGFGIKYSWGWFQRYPYIVDPTMPLRWTKREFVRFLDGGSKKNG